MIRLYPYIHTTYEGTVMAYNLAYMFDKCRWHSPLVKWSGVELCNQDMEDMNVTHEQELAWEGSS